MEPTTLKTRKQRELEQREELFLSIARRHFIAEGYFGLNMDKIALEAEYSKGTIYQHFRNKEDVLVALSVQTMEKRKALFSRGVQFAGYSRQKIQAIGLADVLFAQLYPEHHRVEQVIRSASIRDRTDPDKHNLLRQCEQSCMQTVSGVVELAIKDGDLTLPPERTPQDLTFGLWSIAVGASLIVSSGTQLQSLGVTDPQEAVNHNFDMLLDGYQWRPLSHEFDYRASEQLILKIVFAAEIDCLQARKLSYEHQEPI
jgi:AcrR family transcriptional regulator